MNENITSPPDNELTANLQVQSVQTYLGVMSALEQCDAEIQKEIAAMIAIYRDPETTADEKRAALYTIVEALFPSHSADYMLYCESARRTKQADSIRREMDQEDATFAERLAVCMRDRNLTQVELATKIGVSQPAIANMLNRNVRPQKKTVLKFAEALGVAPEYLWPGIKQ